MLNDADQNKIKETIAAKAKKVLAKVASQEAIEQHLQRVIDGAIHQLILHHLGLREFAGRYEVVDDRSKAPGVFHDKVHEVVEAAAAPILERLSAKATSMAQEIMGKAQIEKIYVSEYKEVLKDHLEDMIRDAASNHAHMDADAMFKALLAETFENTPAMDDK